MDSSPIILLDYPSIHDIKAGGSLLGYPGSLFRVASEYAGLSNPQFITLFPPPPSQKSSLYFTPRKKATDDKANPLHFKHGHLRGPYVADYNRVRESLRGARFVVALGELSYWCLTGARLSDNRGVITYWDGVRVIGSHHPRDIIRQHHLLPVLAMDLKKAVTESAHARSTFPLRRIHVVETLRDMDRAVDRILQAGAFAFDIETADRQITMICFAPSPTEVYVVPIFWGSHNFWTEDEEVQIWTRIQILMASPARKIAHNATYDLTYLKMTGIEARYPVDDTMLLSHSNEIEWLKSLGFLGSIYCNERSWKLLRVGKVKDRNKADE